MIILFTYTVGPLRSPRNVTWISSSILNVKVVLVVKAEGVDTAIKSWGLNGIDGVLVGLTGLRSTVLAVEVEEIGSRDNGETYWDFSDIIEG